MRVYVCSTGLKGAVFIKGLVRRNVPVAKVFSYDQADDRSRSFDDIVAVCRSHAVPLIEMHRPAVAELEGADLIFVVGWQYLIPSKDSRVIVFHDSLLPRYRGFSPTVTSLIAGDDVVGVTAFHPAEDVDTGPILAQAQFRVSQPARIGQVLTQQADLMADVAARLVQQRAAGELVACPQDESKASYSHWRDADDYFIDWSWSAEKIQRFVYALGVPYEGARTIIDQQLAIVTDCQVLSEDLLFAIRQPGKVWRITDRGPIVVCGEGLLRILAMHTASGAEIRITKVRTRFKTRAGLECPAF